jgi:hypothetical protein
MARPLRLEFAGALYYVTSRGDRREMIFESDDDRRVFFEANRRFIRPALFSP